MEGLFEEIIQAPLPPVAAAFSAKMGATTVRFHFDSPVLAAWHEPPFAHLAANGQKADFDIFCFSEPANIPDWLENNRLNPTAHKTFRLQDGIQYCSQEDGLFWLDSSTKTGFFWGNNPSAFEPYRSKPFSRLLFWFFENQGFLWCHGACVASAGGAVLFPNVAGAGKSTVAAAALLGGMDFLGDDYLLVELGRSQVHGMYSSLMLSQESLALLRSFSRASQLEKVFVGNKDKLCHYLHPVFGSQLKATAPLRAIFVPELASGMDSRLEQVSREEVMQAFVSSVQTAWLFGGSPAYALRGFYQLVQKTPARKLCIGRDLTQIPELLGQFFAQVDKG